MCELRFQLICTPRLIVQQLFALARRAELGRTSIDIDYFFSIQMQSRLYFFNVYIYINCINNTCLVRCCPKEDGENWSKIVALKQKHREEWVENGWKMLEACSTVDMNWLPPHVCVCIRVLWWNKSHSLKRSARTSIARPKDGEGLTHFVISTCTCFLNLKQSSKDVQRSLTSSEFWTFQWFGSLCHSGSMLHPLLSVRNGLPIAQTQCRVQSQKYGEIHSDQRKTKQQV